MANIDSYLNQIRVAVYGEDVRNSIHDAIKEINIENTGVLGKVETATQAAAEATNARGMAESAKMEANHSVVEAKKAQAFAEAAKLSAETSAQIASELVAEVVDADMKREIIDLHVKDAEIEKRFENIYPVDMSLVDSSNEAINDSDGEAIGGMIAFVIA